MVEMNSKFLLCMVAGLIVVSYFTADTESADLAFAAESGITYDVFVNPPQFFGDSMMIIASPGKNTGNAQNAGSISVIDVNTNSLLYTINNPEPTENDLFGRHIASLLYTIDSPILGSVSFGETFESFDGKLAVYTRDANPNDEKMMMSSMSLTEKQASLLYTINDPLANTDSDFGRHFTIVDDNTTRETFGMQGIGYPFGVRGGNIQECADLCLRTGK